MIPKRIFFIWIGDKKEPYVDYAVNAFTQINPTYNVMLKHYNPLDDSDEMFNHCIDIYLNRVNGTVNISPDDTISETLNAIINHLRKRNNTVITRDNIPKKHYAFISDMIRFYLLYKHGGIYIDCDTYPVKPFDDKILERNFRSRNDIYFLGCKENEKFRFTWKNPEVISMPEAYKYSDNEREDFYNCKLKIPDREYPSNYYIHHFIKRSWK